ncbi:MAG TPA: BTAD domain-containing putative transcriptional regulator [Gemmatimonadales bacterium]|nr:BTAD domain-containing putative transcriptional regulator [Gemmatimonadales bacterium]
MPQPSRPFQLRTLGAVDLRDPDGRAVDAVLRQPKRLALLAWLAVGSPRRFHRRDTLLALFWPDADDAHARAALRRALYFLRARLGPEVLAGRGDDEIGVPEDALWCDAAAFEAALAAGDAERALGLYRGPLLDGLHVAGASSEFGEWLDRERARFRESAAGAARTLAGRAESAGRSEEAVGWARRALELAPEDETSLRRLMLLLEDGGDRAGALRAHEEFARRMAAELDLEPSAETRALYETIRSREGAPAETPVDERRIAVLPFAVRGDARYGYLSDGLVDLLATKLDGAGELRTVDPRALLRYVGAGGGAEETGERGARAAADPERGRAVARHFGAARFLLGTLVEAAGRLQATASLYDLRGRMVASVVASAESEAELFELVDELARNLLAASGVSPGTRLTRIAALTTGSLDALRAYLLGERELRAGRYFAAMDGFQRAVDEDGSFALAYYRLAAAAAGCALADLAREIADRGLEHRGRLSPHDQLVFRAQRAWLHGELAEAESLYNTIVGTYPDDVEAWFHLGDLLFHTNPLRGRSAVEAREPFERVLRLEPGHLAAMVHLARIAGIAGRRDEMLALAERVARASPEGDQALAMRALRVFAGDDRAAMESLARELQGARALTVAIAFADVAVYSGNLEGAEMLARSFLQVARSPELRALCHIQLAHLALAQGRAEDTVAELERAESLDAIWGLEVRGYFAALPFGTGGADERERLRARLTEWDAATAPPSSFVVFAMHNHLHPAIRLWLLGLLDLALGDPASAFDRAERLAMLPADDARLTKGMEGELRAGIARAEGRPDEGLGHLDATRPRLWFQLTVASPFFTLASRRWLRAELLREAGRTEEAAGWYRSMAERSPYELIYREPAARRLAGLDGTLGS